MYHRILVPVDGSDDSTRALMQALALAKLAAAGAAGTAAASAGQAPAAQQPAALRPLHVLDDALDQSELVAQGNAALAAATACARQAGIAAESAMLPAAGRSLAAVILADAKDFAADLVVIGTHGRKGLRRAILGSVAEEVIRDSRIPVLLPGRLQAEHRQETKP